MEEKEKASWNDVGKPDESFETAHAILLDLERSDPPEYKYDDAGRPLKVELGQYPSAEEDALQAEVARQIWNEEDFQNIDFPADTKKNRRIGVSRRAIRFILRALRHTHKGKKGKIIKNELVRMLFANPHFSNNLKNWLYVWKFLKKGTQHLLSLRGEPLAALYRRRGLRKSLGTYQAPKIADHTQRQDFCLNTPPDIDWSSQAQEEVYIHFLRMVAWAIDESYRNAVRECVAPFIADNESPFSRRGIRSIKGYPRMHNKMLSGPDHRYAPKPRPAQNVDINRCLVPIVYSHNMIGMMKALLKRFGPFAKFKNQMELSEEKAAALFNLRRLMVSLQYNTGLTFGDLCSDPQVQKRWVQYAKDIPPTVSDETWHHQVTQARAWLQDPKLKDEPVVLLCEVQCVLVPYRNVRLDMHEIYKVYRADTDNALCQDFRTIRTQREQEKQSVADGGTPARRCCRDDDVDTLRNSPEVLEAAQKTLKRCLKVATRNHSIASLGVLLKLKGAAAVVRKESCALLMNAIQGKTQCQAHVDVVRQLLDAKASTKAYNRDNHKTALNVAAALGQTTVCQLLLGAGADIAWKESTGQSSFYISTAHGHRQTAELLLQSKADIETRKNGSYTPLLWCSEKGKFEMVRFLLEAKAYVDAKRSDGHTSLMRAARDGFRDVVGLLLSAKASINFKSNHGLTAWNFADRNYHTATAKLLEESGAKTTGKSFKKSGTLVLNSQRALKRNGSNSQHASFRKSKSLEIRRGNSLDTDSPSRVGSARFRKDSVYWR